jgi:small subunit ribosomal protein S2
VVDPKKEKNAISEARVLGVTTIALIDTDCDPDLVDLPVPGNDDGIRSIEVIVSQWADAAIAGSKEAGIELKQVEEEQSEEPNSTAKPDAEADAAS